jgi:eukaryotic-like serine/threonine-protein kinase
MVVHRVSGQGRVLVVLGDARRALDIEHPCVVRVRSVESAGGDVLIASDFVDGETYADLVELAAARRRPIPFGVLLRILADTLSGLSIMHAGGRAARRSKTAQIVHGRFAPLDVSVGLDGIARVVLGGRWARGDETRALGYFAPEALMTGDGEADERSDVYAAGVMLWEALAGTRLYAATTV